MKMFAFLTTFVLFACTKKSGQTEIYTLTGKWKLTDQYIGNIPTGQWTKPTELTYYQFTETDSLIIERGNLIHKIAIQKLSDSTFIERSSPLISTYKIHEDKLTIRNPCDEGCEWRLVRVTR